MKEMPFFEEMASLGVHFHGKEFRIHKPEPEISR